MTVLTSSTINKLLLSNRSLGVSFRAPRFRTVNHVVKIYQNNDVKIKTLSEPLTFPTTGFEEVFLKTRSVTVSTPRIVDDKILLLNNKPTTEYYFDDSIIPDKKSSPKYYLNVEQQLVVDSKGVPVPESHDVQPNGKTLYENVLSTKLKNLPLTRYRTIENIYDILHGKVFDYFLTVTFDDTKIDRSDPLLCSKVLRKRLNNIKNKVKGCRSLEYFGV